MNNSKKYTLGKLISEEGRRIGATAAENFTSDYMNTGGDFFDVPLDDMTFRVCQEFAEGVKGRFDSVVVLGIGGSSLGIEAIYNAVGRENSDMDFYFLDNVDPERIVHTLEAIEWERTLFLVITKSGKTTETISQFYLIENILRQKKLAINEHMVIITDPLKGPLREFATQSDCLSFSIPHMVGGRFSILTAVGLLPACLMGADAEGLLRGARSVRENFLKNKSRHTITRLAGSQFLHYSSGRTNRVNMSYSDKLNKFLDWYTQLMAESLGKDEIGITPINFRGATDQHSALQLYLQGTPDKYFFLYGVNTFEIDAKLPKITHPEFDYMSEKHLSEIMIAEREAIYRTVSRYELPIGKFICEKMDMETLGELFFSSMIEIALLGRLMDINPYDQPAVELSKRLTQQNLRKK